MATFCGAASDIAEVEDAVDEAGEERLVATELLITTEEFIDDAGGVEPLPPEPPPQEIKLNKTKKDNKLRLNTIRFIASPMCEWDKKC